MNNPETTGPTRREFNGVAMTVAVALTIAGCEKEPTQAADGAAAPGGPGERKAPPKLPTEPFAAGKLADYAKPGAYDAGKDSHIWLVSDGKKLVAMSGICTHKGCAVAKAEKDFLFACPCHKAKFDNDGVPPAGAKAERPLERCSVAIVKDAVQIDPTKLFKTKEEWEAAGAFLKIG